MAKPTSANVECSISNSSSRDLSTAEAVGILGINNNITTVSSLKLLNNGSTTRVSSRNHEQVAGFDLRSLWRNARLHGQVGRLTSGRLLPWALLKDVFQQTSVCDLAPAFLR
jgi:hypothetical protein